MAKEFEIQSVNQVKNIEQRNVIYNIHEKNNQILTTTSDLVSQVKNLKKDMTKTIEDEVAGVKKEVVNNTPDENINEILDKILNKIENLEKNIEEIKKS